MNAKVLLAPTAPPVPPPVYNQASTKTARNDDEDARKKEQLQKLQELIEVQKERLKLEKKRLEEKKKEEEEEKTIFWSYTAFTALGILGSLAILCWERISRLIR